MVVRVKYLEIKKSHFPVILYKYGENTPYVIKPHTHDELTLGCIRGGETCLTLNNREYFLKAGDVIIIPAHTVHLCSPMDPKNFSYVILHISPEWIDREFNNRDISPGVITPDINLFNRLMDEVDKDSVYEFFSQIPNLAIKESIPARNLKEIKGYIDEYYTVELSIDELSQRFSINKYSFIRSFKKEYYLSPHQYIMNLRINRAKELIKRGDDFTSVTYDCGFYDQSHFIKTFKTYTGLTPEKFK